MTVDCLKNVDNHPTVGTPVTTPETEYLGDLTPQQRKVYDCLKSANMMLSPHSISQMTDIPSNSVSARLNELREKHLVIKPLHGYWELSHLENPTKPHRWGGSSGMGGVLSHFGGQCWRLQNLHMGVFVSVGVSEVLDYCFDDVRLTVRFGVKRGKISVVIGCSRGLGFSEWLLVLDKIDSVCSCRGFTGLDWTVSMAEFFNDMESRRLDGVSGLTITDFRGFMEKVYEKPDGVVRHERRVNVSFPVEVVTSFLSGGLDSVNVVERLEAMESQLAALTEAVKWKNRYIADMEAER